MDVYVKETMGKKSNNELRQFHDAATMHKKEKDYLVHTGMDEDLADEMATTKRKRKRKEGK